MLALRACVGPHGSGADEEVCGVLALRACVGPHGSGRPEVQPATSHDLRDLLPYGVSVVQNPSRKRMVCHPMAASHLSRS
ncbi:MAG: hypothetical protein JWO22_3512 [Frankiales bacterium]|nr:hypothetical protein [Frankiales bacterium]